jgi:hypothetical protein
MSISDMLNKDKLGKMVSLAPKRIDQEDKKCTCYSGGSFNGVTLEPRQTNYIN